MITITVAAGTGSASRDFGNASFEALSIVSPDNTPMFDFQITDSDGHLKLGLAGIDSQRSFAEIKLRLTGVCTLTVFNAVDDGSYTVKLVPRS